MVNEPHVSLGLLLHNHQPVGNFPWVFQQVYEESYLPMLSALERHPGVRLSLHYTGSLLDWLAEAQPTFLQRIQQLVARGQVEVVGGGYYEPILPSIPDADKVAQIRRLSARIEDTFGTRPSGSWIAERVWEPSLPLFLHQAGIEWTILDDIHFKNVGLEDADLHGYYVTEDQGSTVKVFATSKTLRYTVPWRPVHETITALRALATPDGQRIAVMGDDGEKFGSWPGTYAYCWGNDGSGHSGWVEEFFSALETNSSWLHTVPLGEYASNHTALGRIYIPTSSYIEMTEWALPPQKSYLFSQILHQMEDEKRENILQFLRGGFWRNFLVRYAEVNNQHKKMLRIHDRVYAAGATPEAGVVDLWKAQANDTYWHGLFGGIYMTHVRSAIYHHLILAENAANKQLYREPHWQHYEFTDFDKDSQDELVVETDQQNLYLAPLHGGTLFEWDILRSAHNLTSVMTRRQEGYHRTLREYEQDRRRKAAQAGQQSTHDESSSEPGSPHTTIRTKEADLDHYLVEDPYTRRSLVDHFLPAGLPLQSFITNRYEDQGNFADSPYQASVSQDDQALTITLTRTGLVRRAGALGAVPVQVVKTLTLPQGEEKLRVQYTITNQGQSRLQTLFASEWNFNLLGGGGNEQAYYKVPGQTLENHHFDSTGELQQVHEVHIGNSWLNENLAFVLSQPATLWRYSIDTVTGSEAGFERTHQGSCMTFIWPLLLDAGESWGLTLNCDSGPAGSA